MLQILLVLSTILSLSTAAAPYELCEGPDQFAKIIDIIPYNNTNQTIWMAKSDDTMRADLVFVSKEDISQAELAIVAILDPKGGPGGRPLEVSYGRPENACKLLYDNPKECGKPVIKKDKKYKLRTKFDTPPSLPKISLQVRFILREASQNRLTRVQKTNWRKHPGRMILCALLPVTVI